MLLVTSVSAAESTPKPLVLVEDTQDRWITFSDGSRLNHGFEITHLLLQALYETNKYQLIAPGIESSTGVRTFAAKDSQIALKNILKERLPNIEFTYFGHVQQNSSGIKTMSVKKSRPHIIIRPQVDTLLYASGERSNRIVYGFSPDRLNPYNAGQPGQKDNEFTLTEYGQSDPVSGKVCENVDFFGGQLNPLGFGPALPNFGANSDEGIELFLMGYGFGFKKKTYDLKSEITFEVELPSLNQIKDFHYELRGRGQDIGVGVSYKGLSVAIEIARVKTLRMALQSILTNIVNNFMSDIPPTVWSTHISNFKEGMWLIPVGALQGIEKGLRLESSFGSRYRISEVFESQSIVTPDAQNTYQPFIGEVLAVDGTPIAGGSGLHLMATHEKEDRDLGRLELKDTADPENIPPPESNACLKRNPSTWERLVMGITWLYGYIRYKNIFDQPFNSIGISANQNKIAVIGSGIDPNDKRLKDVIDASGFDFISWDNRPADELGMGTAAALLIKKQLENVRLVPLKVLTPFGNTHSSAIYQALTYAAERPDISTVLVLFKPSKISHALIDGVQKLIEKGKTVVVPQGIKVPGAIEASELSEFKTKGLGGARLKLSGFGAGVVEKFIQLTKSTSSKGYVKGEGYENND